MGSISDLTSPHSALLGLPTEIRCYIYDYLLSDRQAITISAGYVTALGHRVQDRARKVDIPGLPLQLAPLVRCHHDTSILSVADPPTVPIEDGCLDDSMVPKAYPAPWALLRTCRVIRDELTDFTRGRSRIAQVQPSCDRNKTQDQESDKDGLSLYVAYPYGLLVLKYQYPYLLREARRVFISGCSAPPPIDAEPGSPVSPASPESNEGERLTPVNSFTNSNDPQASTASSLVRRHSPSDLAPTNADPGATANRPPSRPRLRLDPPLGFQHPGPEGIIVSPLFPPTTAKLASLALAQLVRTVLSAEPTNLVRLSARIFHPGHDSYSRLWSAEHSPVSRILRTIAGGRIALCVLRGAWGTGLSLIVRPMPDSRIVSTTWQNWTPLPGRGRPRRPLGSEPVVKAKEVDAFLMVEA